MWSSPVGWMPEKTRARLMARGGSSTRVAEDFFGSRLLQEIADAAGDVRVAHRRTVVLPHAHGAVVRDDELELHLAGGGRIVLERRLPASLDLGVVRATITFITSLGGIWCEGEHGSRRRSRPGSRPCRAARREWCRRWVGSPERGERRRARGSRRTVGRGRAGGRRARRCCCPCLPPLRFRLGAGVPPPQAAGLARADAEATGPGGAHGGLLPRTRAGLDEGVEEDAVRVARHPVELPGHAVDDLLGDLAGLEQRGGAGRAKSSVQ